MVIRSVILFRCALVLFGLAGGFWLSEECPGFVRLEEAQRPVIPVAKTAEVPEPSKIRETSVPRETGGATTSGRREAETSKETFFRPTRVEVPVVTKAAEPSRAMVGTAAEPSRLPARPEPSLPSPAPSAGQRGIFGSIDAGEPGGELPPIVAPVGDVAIPVAFQPLASDIELTGAQAEKLEAIRERFVRDIGGPDQDPTSPEYRKRWRFAQWSADQQFRAMFGQQAFLQRQIALSQEDRRAAADGF